MDTTVTQAKAEFSRATDRLTRALATTPDDKIKCAPSLTARTPLHIVVHAAMGTCMVQGMLEANTFPYANVAEFDAASRRFEKEYTTREQALGFLEQTNAAYFAWLDTLTPAQVASTVSTFLGTFELASGITFPADHMRGHAAQIEYLQTTWGDTDWHL